LTPPTRRSPSSSTSMRRSSRRASRRACAPPTAMRSGRPRRTRGPSTATDSWPGSASPTWWTARRSRRRGAARRSRHGARSAVGSRPSASRARRRPAAPGARSTDDVPWPLPEPPGSGSGGGTIALAAGNLGPGLVLVHPDVAGEAEHALAEDVLHDLGGAALDGVGPAAQERLLGGPPEHADAAGALHVVG